MLSTCSLTDRWSLHLLSRRVRAARGARFPKTFEPNWCHVVRWLLTVSRPSLHQIARVAICPLPEQVLLRTRMMRWELPIIYNGWTILCGFQGLELSFIIVLDCGYLDLRFKFLFLPLAMFLLQWQVQLSRLFKVAHQLLNLQGS